MTKDCYNYCCRGIFETHKLMFSLQMTLRIQDGEGRLDMQLVDFFLKGNLSLDKSYGFMTRRRRPTASTSSPTRDGTTCSGSSRSPTTSPT